GMAFTLEERLQLGIHGLIPPCFLSQDVQVLRVMKSYETRTNPLDKYILLMTLQDRNEKLFYRVLTSDTEQFMPIVYTPTVGLACQQYGLAFRRPSGDRWRAYPWAGRPGQLWDGNSCWEVGPLHGVRWCTSSAVSPRAAGRWHRQPDDPLYIGLKHKRIRGKEYDELIDEFMQAVTDKYGMSCLIQFEDFANSNAFRILNKYRNRYCTFNDDIQGTASVAVAGIFAAQKITKDKLLNHTFVFQGAGEGRGIFASGSPFDKVTLADGRTFFPGQGNNAYVFPGVALGVIACGVRHISEDIFLTTAEVVNYAYQHNMASVYPEPKDKEAFVLSQVYSPDYDSFTLDTYSWPQEAMNVQDV
ncbi:hypothetical protein GOODEAATRI_006524, partial [Goodea atripinnis]